MPPICGPGAVLVAGAYARQGPAAACAAQSGFKVTGTAAVAAEEKTCCVGPAVAVVPCLDCLFCSDDFMVWQARLAGPSRWFSALTLHQHSKIEQRPGMWAAGNTLPFMPQLTPLPLTGPHMDAECTQQPISVLSSP